jgi:HAD superfamily hydrolase (TIGR01490 family)
MTPPRKPRLTLFDLDHTLLPLDSDHGWGEFMIQLGWVEPSAFRARNDAFYEDYKAGVLDMHAYVAFNMAPVVARSPAEAARGLAAYMQQVIGPAVLPAAIALVEQHRRTGDLMAIVTATNDWVTAPIVRAFGVDHHLATELAVDHQGHPTGGIRGLPNLREGKRARVLQWLRARGQSPQDFHITAYSDSPNDLPLLDMADTAVVTNGSAPLKATAAERGWATLDLFSHGTTAE